MENLPIEFQALSDRVQYVQKITENEWHSNCPQCGGVIHEDGSFPDRFVMWISSRRTGLPFAMCLRGHCGYKWSPAKQDANWTEEERAEFRAKREEMERQYELQLAKRLEELSEKIKYHGFYQKYYEECQKHEQSVAYWTNYRKIPADWQKYLWKGVLMDYTVKNRLTEYQSPAFTNPIWTVGGRIENIKLRVAKPMDKNDRFRNLYKSGCQHLYTPEYEKPMQKTCVLMEGENKADSVAIHAQLNEQISVFGVQSKTPERRVLKMLDECEVVYIAFDPDAYEYTVYTDNKGVEKKSPPSVIDTANQIGKERVRFVIPPRGVKFDDAIHQGFNFKSALNMAVRFI